MKKQLLALAISATLISSNALAASVVVSSNGTPVASNISPVVTSGTGAAEALPSKPVMAYKSINRTPFKTASKYEPKPAPKKVVKKRVVKKKVETKTESKTDHNLTTTNTTTTINTTTVAPAAVVAPAVTAPVTTAPVVTQPVTAPVAPARIQ